MHIDLAAIEKVSKWKPLVGKLMREQASTQSTALLLAPNLLLTCAHVLVEEKQNDGPKLDNKKIEEIVSSAKQKSEQNGSNVNDEINNVIREDEEIIRRIKGQFVSVGNSYAFLNPFSDKGGFLHITLRGTEEGEPIGAERLDFAIVGLHPPNKEWPKESIRAWTNLTPFIFEKLPDQFEAPDEVYILGYPLSTKITKDKEAYRYQEELSFIRTMIVRNRACYFRYYRTVELSDVSGEKCSVTSINPGLSGAPVFNRKGKWLGFHHGVEKTEAGAEGLAVKVYHLAKYIERNNIILPLIKLDDRFLHFLAGYYQQKLTQSIFKPKCNRKSNKLVFPINEIYTKLFIVKEEEKKQINDQIGEKEHTQRLEAYEDCFRNENKLKLKDLFKHGKKRLMIYGAAGVGKTMMSFRLASKTKKWPDCSALFLIQLSNLNGKPYRNRDYKADEVIARECGFEDKPEYMDLLKKKNFRDRAVLLLDGYDEFPQGVDHLDTMLSDLSNSFNRVIVTSRPGMPYPPGFDEENSLELEIMGFDDKSKNRYIDNFFRINMKNRNEAEAKSEKLKKNLADQPFANSLAHIPMNLCFICALTLQGKSLFIDERSMTVSYFYHEMVKWFYKQALPRFLKVNPLDLQNDDDPRRSYRNKIDPLAKVLEEIAWEAMDKDTLDIPKSEIPGFSDWINLGLIKEIKEEVYRFTHLTFQEYFAASALAQLYLGGDPDEQKEALKRVKEKKFDLRYQIMLSMTAGILSLEYEKAKQYEKSKQFEKAEEEKYKKALQSYFDHLYEAPRDIAESYELQLFARCFEECVNPEVVSDHYPSFIESALKYFEDADWHELRYRLLNRNNKLLNHPKMEEAITKRLENTQQCSATLELLRGLARHSQALPSNIVSKLLDISKGILNNGLYLPAIEVIRSLAWSGAAFNEEVQETAIPAENKANPPRIKILNKNSTRKPNSQALHNEGVKSSAGTPVQEKLIELIKIETSPYPDARQKAAMRIFIALADTKFTFTPKTEEALIKRITDGERKRVMVDEEGEAKVLVHLAKSSPSLNEKVQKALIALMQKEEMKGKIIAFDFFLRLIKLGITPSKEAKKALIELMKSEKENAFDVQLAVAEVFIELAKFGTILDSLLIDQLQGALIDSMEGASEAAGKAIVELGTLEAAQNEKAPKVQLPLIVNGEEDWATLCIEEVGDSLFAKLAESQEHPNREKEEKVLEESIIEIPIPFEKDWAAAEALMAVHLLVNLLISGAALNRELQQTLMARVGNKEVGGAVDWFRKVGAEVLIMLAHLGDDYNQKVQEVLIKLITSEAKGAAADRIRETAVCAFIWIPKRATDSIDEAQHALIKLIEGEAKSKSAQKARQAAIMAISSLKGFKAAFNQEVREALLALIMSAEKEPTPNELQKMEEKYYAASRPALSREGMRQAPEELELNLKAGIESAKASHRTRKLAAYALADMIVSDASPDKERTMAEGSSLDLGNVGCSWVGLPCECSSHFFQLFSPTISAGVVDEGTQKALIELMRSEEKGKSVGQNKGAVVALLKAASAFDEKRQDSFIDDVTSGKKQVASNWFREEAEWALVYLAGIGVTFSDEVQHTLLEFILSEEGNQVADKNRVTAVQVFCNLAFSGVGLNVDIQRALIKLIQNKVKGKSDRSARLSAIKAFAFLAKSQAVILKEEIKKALIALIRRRIPDETCRIAMSALCCLEMYGVIASHQEVEEVLIAVIKKRGKGADETHQSALRDFLELVKPGVTLSQDGQEALMALIKRKNKGKPAYSFSLRHIAARGFAEFAKSGAPLSETTQRDLIAFITSGDHTVNGEAMAAVFGGLAKSKKIAISTEEVQRALVTLFTDQKWGVCRRAEASAKALAELAKSGITLIPDASRVLIDFIKDKEDHVVRWKRVVAEVIREIAEGENSRNCQVCRYSSLPFVSDEGKGKEEEKNSSLLEGLTA